MSGDSPRHFGGRSERIKARSDGSYWVERDGGRRGASVSEPESRDFHGRSGSRRVDPGRCRPPARLAAAREHLNDDRASATAGAWAGQHTRGSGARFGCFWGSAAGATTSRSARASRCSAMSSVSLAHGELHSQLGFTAPRFSGRSSPAATTVLSTDYSPLGSCSRGAGWSAATLCFGPSAK